MTANCSSTDSDRFEISVNRKRIYTSIINKLLSDIRKTIKDHDIIMFL